MDERTEGHRQPRSASSLGEGSRRRLIAVSARLLDLQYRLWLRDLRDPEQPMIEYGFRLSPASTGIDGRACRYDAADGQATVLLDKMLLHGRPGGDAIAVDRRSLTISPARIHEWTPSAQFVRGTAVAADVLVPRLISWIGGYEQWVLDTRGDVPRRELARDIGLDGELPTRWWSLAAEWRAMLAHGPKAS